MIFLIHVQCVCVGAIIIDSLRRGLFDVIIFFIFYLLQKEKQTMCRTIPPKIDKKLFQIVRN